MKKSLIHNSIVFALILLLLSSCAAHRFSEFKHKEVHIFKMLKIGGVKQAVLINGNKATNPVLVFLHGGPGFPMLPFDPFSEIMKKLEDKFTIVYWEQRGTGKSFDNSITPESMNMSQFLSDTKEVVDFTKKTLNVDKVFLWGHSWGSSIGAIYASKFPEDLHAYMSTGQSVNPLMNERLAYEFVLKKSIKDNNKRALNQINKIDTVAANYSLESAFILRKWVYRYGGIVYKNKNERPYVDIQEIRQILAFPSYSLKTRMNLILNPNFSAVKLWEEIKKINLFEQAPTIKVPVYFFVGRHDIIVSHVLAEEYFNKLDAPKGKTLFWFEESAHRPFEEEMEKFYSHMVKDVLSVIINN